MISNGSWIPENGLCSELYEEFAQPNTTIRKIGVKIRPQLRNYFKYRFDDPEYARHSNFQSDSETEMEIESAESEKTKSDVHWKVSRWQTENIGRESPTEIGDGWSIPSRRNSAENSGDNNDDGFVMETFGEAFDKVGNILQRRNLASIRVFSPNLLSLLAKGNMFVRRKLRTSGGHNFNQLQEIRLIVVAWGVRL